MYHIKSWTHNNKKMYFTFCTSTRSKYSLWSHSELIDCCIDFRFFSFINVNSYGFVENSLFQGSTGLYVVKFYLRRSQWISVIWFRSIINWGLLSNRCFKPEYDFLRAPSSKHQFENLLWYGPYYSINMEYAYSREVADSIPSMVFI